MPRVWARLLLRLCGVCLAVAGLALEEALCLAEDSADFSSKLSSMPRVLRPVRPEEMTVDKGEPENQLRRDVLGLFPDDQSVRDHLPAEWTPEAVRAFGAFLLAKSQPPLELARYGFVNEKGGI